MLSFLFLDFYCIIFSHVSFKHYWKTVLTFIQSFQMGHYQTRKRICKMPLNAYALFAVIKVSKGAKIRNRCDQVKRYSTTQMVWNAYELYLQMSRYMRFLTMWYVQRVSLRIRAVWSEPLLVVWIYYEYLATAQTAFWLSKLKRRLHRLVWIYTCQNATLLEITSHGSINNW